MSIKIKEIRRKWIWKNTNNIKEQRIKVRNLIHNASRFWPTYLPCALYYM